MTPPPETTEATELVHSLRNIAAAMESGLRVLNQARDDEQTLESTRAAMGRQVEHLKDAAEQAARLAGHAIKSPGAQTPVRPTRVLCVDDRPDVATAMRLLIQSASMECVGCLDSADDLVDEVQRRDPRPDVVILDATMPGKDSMTAMAELAAACPDTRTIIYSGYDDAALVRRAREAGAWGCVSKHDEPKALLRAVKDVAAGRTVWPGRSAAVET